MPITLRPLRAGGVVARHSQSGAPPACSGRAMRFQPPPSGKGYVHVARRARLERVQRAAFVRRRRIAMPATTSSWAVLDAGKGVGSSSASRRSASSRRPIRRRRRISRYRACAAFNSSSVAGAASSQEQQREGGIEYKYRREARTASCITPTPLMRADWMASGACTSGSIAPPSAVIRPGSRGAATTSTTSRIKWAGETGNRRILVHCGCVSDLSLRFFGY